MKNNKHGLTLLEILAVIALLGLVMSFLGTEIFSKLTRGKTDATRIMIKQLEQDLDRYRFDCNTYPTTAQGMKALIEAPGEEPTCRSYDPNGYYSGKKKELPRDPFDTEFEYTCEDGINYVIKSYGPDKKPGGGDDISSDDE